MGGVGYLPNKQTQILRTLKLTGHFIQFFVVETEQYVNSNPNGSLLCFFFVYMFVVIKPENPYFAPGLEVKPLGVYPLGQHSSSCSPTKPKIYHRPETLYVPSEVKSPQVDGLPTRGSHPCLVP